MIMMMIYADYHDNFDNLMIILMIKMIIAMVSLESSPLIWSPLFFRSDDDHDDFIFHDGVDDQDGNSNGEHPQM